MQHTKAQADGCDGNIIDIYEAIKNKNSSNDQLLEENKNYKIDHKKIENLDEESKKKYEDYRILEEKAIKKFEEEDLKKKEADELEKDKNVLKLQFQTYAKSINVNVDTDRPSL